MSEMKSCKGGKNKCIFVTSCAGCESVFNLQCMVHLSKFIFSFNDDFFSWSISQRYVDTFHQQLDIIFPFLVLSHIVSLSEEIKRKQIWKNEMNWKSKYMNFQILWLRFWSLPNERYIKRKLHFLLYKH